MTATHWVMIGLALWSTFTGFFMWAITRRVKKQDERAARQDAFEKKCGEFVTRDVLREQLSGISEEGIARENRITAALERQTLTIGGELRELRNEIRQDRADVRREFNESGRRIDELIRLDRGGGFRRT